MRRIYNFIFLLCLLLSNLESIAQPKFWSLLIDKEVDRFQGYQVYEADSFYYVVGTSIDEFGKPEQGFSVSKVDKNNASVASTVHYEESGVQFDFNQCRKGYLIDSLIYFPQTTVTLPASIQLFSINIHTLKVEKKLSLPPPDSTSKYTMFLSDFIKIDSAFYFLIYYSVGSSNTSNFKSIPFIYKFNYYDNSSTIIYFFDEIKLYMHRMTPFKEGLLILATIPGQLVATGKLVMFFLTNEGELKWKYETPDLSPISDIRDIYVLNDKEIMFVSYDSEFSYSDFYLRSRWTVTKFDTENKKIIWSNHWNEPRKQEIWAGAKIIKGFRDNEYLLMANDIVKTDTLYYTTGKIVKFNSEGKRLWQKTYYYSDDRGFNEFNNIIQTSDKNYLVVGFVFSSPPQSAWLVKIDEDGNILPIDTVSATVDWSVPSKSTEISIYPNPAASSIIINQGEIADVQYLITDMTGRTMQQITVASAHQNTIWDIADLPCGTYVITMMHNQKIIGQIKQVVVK